MSKMVVFIGRGCQLKAAIVVELSQETDLFSNGTMPLASLSKSAMNFIKNAGTFLVGTS